MAGAADPVWSAGVDDGFGPRGVDPLFASVCKAFVASGGSLASAGRELG